MLMALDRTRYLTIEEAAQKSGYDYEHLRKLVKSGAVASLEISERSRLVDWEDLQRYLRDKPQRKPRPKGRKRQSSTLVKPPSSRPTSLSDALRRAAAQAHEDDDPTAARYEDIDE